MKLKVLVLSILFIITTTLSALHELEHITHDHESDPSCLVYHINDKLSPIDLEKVDLDTLLYTFETIPLHSQLQTRHTKKSTNHATAPPFLS